MGYERLRDYVKDRYSEQMGEWIHGRAVYAFLGTLCIYGDMKMYKDLPFSYHFYKKWKKVGKKFGEFEKTSYLCTRLKEIPASVAQLVRAPDC